MKKVKIGVIGLGFFGEKHLDVLSTMPQVEIYAVCTRNTGRLKAFAEKYSVPKQYTDYKELINDSNIDVVNIVTHVDAHYEPALYALNAGKHVFLEKPMAPTVEECDRIVEAVGRSSRCFMTGHICRFDTNYRMAKNKIDSGEIGEVLTIYTRRNLSGKIGEFVLDKISPITGDIIHDVDLMLWMTGYKIKSVYALSVRARKFKNPDIGWAVFHFENGAAGIAESAWCLPEKTPFDIDSRMEIIGTKGAIYIYDSNSSFIIDSESGRRNPDLSYWPVIDGKRIGALRVELDYFLNCIMEDRKPDIIKPWESREAVRAVLAAEESSKRGEIVYLLK